MASLPLIEWLRCRSFHLRVQECEAPESLAVGEHEPAVGLVVVPDLQAGLCGTGLALLDLVGRAIADVGTAHVRAPSRTEAEEVLVRIAQAPEELDLVLVAPGLRRGIAAA